MARPTTPRRLILALAGSIALTAMAGPALSALSAAYPAQSLGDRGTDVLAIQLMLRQQQARPGPAPAPGGRTSIIVGRNPIIVPTDGIFGAATAAGVAAFQFSRELPASGIADTTTWSQLIVPTGPGASGDAVLALQHQLREKRSAAVPLDGVYGTTTRTAVVAFQAHMGLPQTGSVDAATWRTLLWHFEPPRFSAAALCDNSTGNGPANWGTAEMIATLEASGAAMVAAGYGRVVVNDVSFEHGGDIPGHVTHEVGLDADLRPMRKANDQCSAGTRWNLTTYDRTATRALINALHAATPGHVKVIFFNDPVLIREGLTRYHSAHDDHLHVRICEAWNVDARYRC